tara:strand:+ start:2224 stop:2739 length:516 start_codon:yes stop_codon:yes gene_type:complete
MECCKLIITSYGTRHFRNLESMTPWQFFWRTSVESVVIVYVWDITLGTADSYEVDKFLDWPLAKVLLVVGLIVPIYETLIFQVLLISVVRWLKGNIYVQLTISTLAFVAMHVPEDGAIALSVAVAGFYLGFAFTSWYPRHKWIAVIMPIAVHSFHNYLVIVLLIISGEFSI